uniref:Uncharacterized protein n=1 Tax=Anguilla anguilla TaxID=7936 RepID=A0A0E9VUS4_ANGAN
MIPFRINTSNISAVLYEKKNKFFSSQNKKEKVINNDQLHAEMWVGGPSWQGWPQP